jgi:hypothetical protein
MFPCHSAGRRCVFDEGWTEQGASAWTLRHPASLASFVDWFDW